MKTIFRLLLALLFVNNAYAQSIIPSSVATIVPGTSIIVGGTSGKMLYDNAGVVGEANVYAATNNIELRNSTNAQSILINRTYTSSTSYERLFVGADHAASGITGFGVFAEAGSGGGTARGLWIGTVGSASLSFVTNNSSKWNINSSGHFLTNTDNTYDIGASGATRPRNYYGGGTVIAASTIQSTAGNVLGNAFVLNRSSTSYGSILDNGDGVMRFYNGAATSFTGIQMGGTSNQFPSIYTVNPATSSPGIRIQTADLSTGVYLQGLEQTAPAAAPANGYRIFAQDNGAGKTQLMVIFSSGAAQQIAIEP